MKRALIVVLVSLALIGVALPYAPIDFLKGPLERALARGMGRKVEVDRVALALFSGPGFSLDGVTIHEDPRAGIEPFVYATTLDARLDPLALLRGRLEFTSLNFNDATFNLVKPDDAPWNFQLLLNQSPALRLPALKMRGGRVNFKFGQTKAVVFFDDTDLDVSSGAGGAVNLRFSGVPARTDHAVQDFGHFFVRGVSTPSAAGQRLNLRVELEPSSFDGIARLFTAGGADLKGMVSLDAQVSGETSHLAVDGTGQLEGGGQWKWAYTGALDLVSQTLNLATSNPAANAPLKIRLAARNLLSRPEWDASAEFTDAPIAAALNAARKLALPLPPKLTAQGAANGTLRYANAGGLGGNLEVSDLVVTQPDATPLKASTATVFLKGETVLVGPVTVNFGDTQDSAEVESTYQTGEGGGLEVKIATRRMNVSDLRDSGFGAGPLAAPLMDRATGGTWRGSLRYAKPNASAPSWSGDFEIQDTQIAIDGLAEPVRLIDAAVTAKPERIVVTRMKGHAGAIDFSGDYSWNTTNGNSANLNSTGAVPPPSFHLRIDDADAQELERLFHPTVSREGGLLARTLGIGANDAVPDWLTKRRAEGAVVLKSLMVAGTRIAGAAHVVWSGPEVTLSAIQGKVDDASLAGELKLDLSARAPAYAFIGKLEDVAYQSGKLDLNGTAEAAGSGAALLLSVHAAGTVRGRSLVLSPGAEYRRGAGNFTLTMTPAGPLWKLSELELSQGAATFSGDATQQPDGKLTLEIHRD